MRSLSTAAMAAILNATGERVFLIALEFSGTTIYLCTGSHDLLWDSQTWTAVGGNLVIGPIESSQDMQSGAGMDLALSGVDQSIVSILLSQEFRGRSVTAWQAFLDKTSGEVLDTIELFVGAQLENYEVEENVSRDTGEQTVTIRTRIRHRLGSDEYRGIYANVHSHQRFYTNDTFFQFVPSLSGRKIYWGAVVPSIPGGQNDNGGGGDGGGGPGGSGYDPNQDWPD